MDDAIANAIKERLDKDLAKAGPNVGIAFGLDLFNAFRDRQWIDLKTFGVLGTNFGSTKLPAYGAHFALDTWDLGEHEYKVGTDATNS